ncbi:small integral membrane protein 15-like [Actinia tenebrosa]|uniref:Small integral membrane protein 15 n=1 Tax=Actinia tenebrosa TaxID=6105 RepID=A0A6P8I733_ACTTE|nr:small integral membrane protein 15-like [Actinia tenebrosa]
MADKVSTNNSSWSYQLEEFLKYAATNPKDFLIYVFVFLTPLMVICGILSLKLAHHIEQREKEKKKKATRQSNMAKTKKKLKVK